MNSETVSFANQLLNKDYNNYKDATLHDDSCLSYDGV